MAAVVVTESLDWKLHGFDLLSEHSLPGDFALRHASWLAPSQYLPGELAKADWEGIRAGPPFAVDAWGLGCMLQVRAWEQRASVSSMEEGPKAMP